MKPERFWSRLHMATLAVLLLLAHSTAPADSAWLQRAADGVLAEYDRESVLVLGELHGTQEAPALAVVLAQRLSSDGTVVLALEMPRQEQARLDAYLSSDGGPDSVAELLEGDFWRVEPERSDGRRSEAMLQLLESVRALRVANHALEIQTLDDARFQDRREGMAERLIELYGDPAYDIVLALIGNYHARLSPFSMPVLSEGKVLDQPPFPMAARITAVPLMSVNVTACSGSFWGCPSAGSCGPVNLPGQCPADFDVQVVVDDPNATGYNLTLVFPQLTPSLPVR